MINIISWLYIIGLNIFAVVVIKKAIENKYVDNEKPIAILFRAHKWFRLFCLIPPIGLTIVLTACVAYAVVVVFKATYKFLIEL